MAGGVVGGGGERITQKGGERGIEMGGGLGEKTQRENSIFFLQNKKKKIILLQI